MKWVGPVIALLVIACSQSAPPPIDSGVTPDASEDVDIDTPPPCTSGDTIGPATSSTTKTTTVNGVKRTYVLNVPQTAVDAMSTGCGAALVIGLHGAGDTAANYLAATGLTKTANTRGFVLAGPQALSGLWVLQQPTWTSPDGHPTSLWNDIALVQQIIADVEGAYRIDPKQVFVNGLSRGGYFTGILATASDNPGATGGPYTSPFAAYAICAGADAYNGTVSFAEASPKNPIWMIHGTADAQVLYSDGQAFSNKLIAAGWPVTFTPVQDAPHDWLWQTKYGHSNDELWDWFAAHPAP